MKRIGFILALVLFSAVPALAQNPGVQRFGPVANGDCVEWKSNTQIQSTGNPCSIFNIVSNNTALKALSISGLPAGYTVFRTGFAAVGDGGNAQYYLSTSACVIVGGDNGSQVAPNSGTGCWILQAPSTGVDLRVWGGLPGTNVNDELQAAINWACVSHIPVNIVIAPQQYVLTQQIVIGDGTSSTFSTCNGVTIQGVQPFSSFASPQLMAIGWGGSGGIVPIKVQGPISQIVIRNIGVDCFGSCSTGFEIVNALESEFDWLSVAGNIGPAYVISTVPDNNSGAGMETSYFKNLNASLPGTGGSGMLLGDISCASDCNISVINTRFDNLNLTYDGQTAGTYGIKIGMVTQTSFVHSSVLRFNNLGSDGNSIVVSPAPGALSFPDGITFYDLVSEGSITDTAGWVPANGGITFYGFSSIYNSGVVPISTSYGNFKGWTDTGIYFPNSASWTPTDASGAGLSLTVGNATFYKIGDLCTISFSVTYPVTVDATAAALQLPANCTPRNAAPAVAGGGIAFSDQGAAYSILIDGSNGHLLFYNFAGVGLANAGLSGKIVRASLTFTVR